MSLDTSKTIESVTYKGVEFTLAESSNSLKPFKVTITGTESNGSTTYSSDKTYSEIKAAFDDGNYYIYAILEGWSGLYRLTQCSESAVFDASDPYWFSQIRVSTDNSVEVSDSAIETSVFYITLIWNDDTETYSADKTFDEILAAYKAGRVVMCIYDFVYYVLNQFSETDNIITFSACVTEATGMLVCENGEWSMQDCVYVKMNNWSDTDKGKYLKIDNNGTVYAGILDSVQSNDFTVTATLASLALTTATVDKTLAEIEAAYQAGKNISCTLVISGSNGAAIKLTSVERLTLSGAFVFSGLAASYMSSTETYAAVFLKITSDGNTFTTKTLT